MNRRFTSARIWTKQAFGYGKVEVKAAMAKGEFLWDELLMWPFERNRAVHLVKIIKYYQKVNELDVSVDYNDNEKFKNTWTLFTALNPNEFNVYSVEWNETTIIWKLNSRKTLSANLEKIFPGLNEMHILIWQAVGGYVFETKDISLNDLKNWDCPTLLIDYVRYYRWVNESIDKEPVIKEDNPSRDSICMALDASTKKLSDKNLRQNTNTVSDGNVVYDYVSYYSKPINVAYYDGVINSPSTPNNDYLEMTK